MGRLIQIVTSAALLLEVVCVDFLGSKALEQVLGTHRKRSGDGVRQTGGRHRLMRRAEREKPEGEIPSLGADMNLEGLSEKMPALGTVWPEGKIPYWIDDVNDEDGAGAEGFSGALEPNNPAIEGAIANWQKETCLQFIKCETREDCEQRGHHVRFRKSFTPTYERLGKGSACHAHAGMNPGGEATISLPDWCMRCAATTACPGPNCAQSWVECPNPERIVTDAEGLEWYTSGVEIQIGHVLGLMHNGEGAPGVGRDAQELWFNVDVAGVGLDVGAFNPGDASVMFGSGYITQRDAEFIGFMYGDCKDDAADACTATIDELSPPPQAGRDYELKFAIRTRHTPSAEIGIDVDVDGTSAQVRVSKDQGNSGQSGWMNYAGARIAIPLDAASIGSTITVSASFTTSSGHTSCSAQIVPVDPCHNVSCVQGVCNWPGACLCHVGWVGEKCDQPESAFKADPLHHTAMTRANAGACAVRGLKSEDHFVSNRRCISEGAPNSCYNCAHQAQHEGLDLMCRDCHAHCGDNSCARMHEVLETTWVPRSGYCETYGYNRNVGNDLSVALLTCAEDPNCAAVADWNCGEGKKHPYQLCARDGYTFTERFGTDHCLKEKGAKGQGEAMLWTGPCSTFDDFGESVCASIPGCGWRDELCQVAHHKEGGDIDREKAASKYGDDACKCVGIEGLTSTTAVTIDNASVPDLYPNEIGSHCAAWDEGKYPGDCDGDEPKDYCAKKWCYVDPCDCGIATNPTPSGYLKDGTYAGKQIYFSYATCGATNSYNTPPSESMAKECDKELDESIYGTGECPCVGVSGLEGTTGVVIDNKTVSDLYPADFGSTCAAWDANTYPGKCDGSSPESFCNQSWCYVNTDNCILPKGPFPSGYLPQGKFQGKPLYFSYVTCGGVNSYEEDSAPAAEGSDEAKPLPKKKPTAGAKPGATDAEAGMACNDAVEGFRAHGYDGTGLLKSCPTDTPSVKTDAYCAEAKCSVDADQANCCYVGEPTGE